MKTHYKVLIPDASDNLGQWDLRRPDGTFAEPIVEIEKVQSFKPRRLREGEKNKRIRITFVGKRKTWLAGPVSHETLKGMFGPYIEDWIGKKIRLYFDPSVMFGKVRTGGIRIRPTKPGEDEEPTSDPLDNPVDEETANRIEEARADAGFLDDGKDAAQ